MGLKEQINQNAGVTLQMAQIPSGCKVCERKGLPVFPLRVAVVPQKMAGRNWVPAVPDPNVELTGGLFKYALRTLRMGYLYVLLDKKYWQAYEVTAEGYLRQITPSIMPEGDTVTPLAPVCVKRGHEIAASFINIDTAYSQAWLAFSSDPWSSDVLDKYQSSPELSTRFTQIDLNTLKQNPASIPQARVLDPSLSVLKANVAEFAATFYPWFENPESNISASAHGFYPRHEGAEALAIRIAQLQSQFKCPIAALILPDEVGIVEELNNARIQVADACQAYTSRPEILHKYLISQAIGQYLDSTQKAIDRSSQAKYKFPENQPTVWGGKVITAEQAAEETFAEQFNRLRKSYNEPVRAAFITDYASRMETWEDRNKAIGKDLAAWYRAKSWLMAIGHDYAPDISVRSWVRQFLTVSACIQGGGMDTETDDVWSEWIKNPGSPAYIGFAGMQSSLIDIIFSGGNVYSNLKTAVLSDEYGNYLKGIAIKQSWTSRMAALSGSVARLNNKLDEAAYQGFQRMMQAALLTATGESVVVFEYKTTIGQLQKEIKAAKWFSPAMAKNETAFGGLIKNGSTSATDWIIGIQQKNLLAQEIVVQKSILGTLEDIKRVLEDIGQTDLPLSHPQLLDHVHNMHISGISLQNPPHVNIMMSRPQIDAFNERMRRYISGNGFGVVLAMGMLALQMADWQAKAKSVQDAVNNTPDAVADYAINRLMVTGAVAETAGFAHMLTIKKNWIVWGPDFVHPLVKFGGVLAGAASVVDGVRMAVNGGEAYDDGDNSAAWRYGAAALVTVAGGTISGAGALFGIFTLFSEAFLLGPAGWGAVLILQGMILAWEASHKRSTPFEVWLRSCCFGIPHDSDFVWHENSEKDLNSALEAYYAITSGMIAEIDITGTAAIQTVDYNRVDIKICLPGYDDTISAWELFLEGGDNNVLFSKSHNRTAVKDRASITYSERYSDSYQQSLENGSLIIRITVWVKQSSNPVVTLVTNYWPDKSDTHNKLALTIRTARGWWEGGISATGLHGWPKWK